jgi:predicted unusual protein kinase regulating ubiquinone biosynthesis (AarF/ABC1/UbiB family)
MRNFPASTCPGTTGGGSAAAKGAEFDDVTVRRSSPSSADSVTPRLALALRPSGSNREDVGEDERRVPEGRFSRLARLAAAGARSGAGFVLSKGSERAAHSAAEALGNLRGLAAKVGQMASYVDGVVPEAHREAYETAMGRLRAAAPTSKPDEVRALVEEELGAPIDELFAEWQDTPLASASIGQVHTARVRGGASDGLEVAVKVQHPGITKALEADLANAGIVEQMAGAMGARRFNSKAVLGVIRQRFREELDYRLEAERLRYFRELHAHDDRIHVPAVVAERSSGRVLATELVRGEPFERACEADEALRQQWARTLWRFVFRGNLRGGMFNADPHPGNYIFHEEGRVSFLDFGCVQPISEMHRTNARAMHRAAIDRDEEAFRLAARAMIGTKPGKFEELLLGYVRGTFETLWNRPYRITRPYAASLVDGFKEAGQVARKMKDHEITPVSEDLFFINRLQFGFYSVLARLDVEVDYAAEEMSFWDEPDNYAI